MKIILLRTCFPLAGDEASTDGEAEGDGQVPVAVKEGIDDIVGAELIVGIELMVVLVVVGIELMVGNDVGDLGLRVGDSETEGAVDSPPVG